MVRSELIAKLHNDSSDLSAAEVDRIVSCIFEAMAARLVEGGRVELRGFGTFHTRARAERVGRNPRTGVAVDVQAKRVALFKAGRGMFERLNR